MASTIQVDKIQDTGGNTIVESDGSGAATTRIPATYLGSGTASSTTVLYGDQTYKAEPGGAITAASQWRLTTNFTGEADTMDSNLEEVDTDGGGVIGTSMTESSGIFTFPSTGYWLITFTLNAYNGASFDYSTGVILTTINNADYDAAASCDTNIVYVGDQTPKNSATTSFLFDVTSTTNCKVHFKVENSTGGAIGTTGNTAKNATYFTFVRLGDT